ncbi:IS200/IS605 family transposase [Fulvivirga sedimenti]|uniref:IS200/IS605 family transposase n=1 Tax=Fulvivirga sedimenti TaxID=2879465 RepID=A0A9X1HXR2_9BACT|nr:IS200/IS605 family transposase [Fulvivirga sedimenti]MCA6078412.1 IS200/IS605 family transposase [Fulvivirga sedimenti]
MNLGSTYSAHFVQIVFSVHRREPLLSPIWEAELYKYIAGIINNRGNKSIAINGMPDHIHILIKLSPGERVSDLVREVKKSSLVFIRKKLFGRKQFNWQRGYAVISYNERDLDRIKNYIAGQKEHHRFKSPNHKVDPLQ